MKVDPRMSLVSLIVSLAPLAAACGAPSAGDPATGVETAALSGPPTAPSGNVTAPRHGRHHRGGCFTRFDADGDGKVTLSELPDRVRTHLAAKDANGDGVLTRDEMDAARAEFMSKMQAKADTNHDGTVSEEERRAAWKARADEHFAQQDKNGDQALTADEVRPEEWEHIRAADSNGDGRVERDELAQAFRDGAIAHPGHRSHRMHPGAADAAGADTTTL